LVVTCLRKFATKYILYFPPHLIYVLLLYLVTRAAIWLMYTDAMSSCASRFFRHFYWKSGWLNAVHWRVMNTGLHCNFTRGLMHFNAPLWLRTKSFTVSTFFAVRALWRRPLPGCLALVPVRCLSVSSVDIWYFRPFRKFTIFFSSVTFEFI